VFERFTDRARRVLQLAQEEARLLNHSFIGTEHLLLGLIHEGDGVGAQALRSLGISHEAVLEKVEETIGMAGTAPSGAPPFTPRAKKVLELALREALQLNHSYIGTEHILLGLVREGEGVAATVLVSLGADLGRVRQEVNKLMAGGQEPHGGGTVSELHGAVGTRREASEPLCIRCRASVSSEARFRTIEVNPDAGNPSPMAIHVVYCRQCGTTLHMFKVEDPS
jgi:ATP-dependent Clp protease ATP-binding subunit ClpC